MERMNVLGEERDEDKLFNSSQRLLFKKKNSVQRNRVGAPNKIRQIEW